MPIKRHFLGLAQHPLRSAADWLRERYSRGGDWDLSQVIVVTPGTRSGRRLLEILVDHAEAQRLTLTPPTFATEGRVPELLYEPKRPFAGDLVQQLCWSEALQAMPPAERRALLPHPPAKGDFLRWLELGDSIRRLHLELAADGLDFRDVLERGKQLPQFDDPRRWETLARLQRAYLDRLDALGLWDKQTARLVAIKHREPKLDRDLVLLGAVDLNKSLRRMIDLAPERVVSLVAAPQEWANRFDEHGCLVISEWLAAPIQLQEEQIIRTAGPADQAEEAVRWLSELDGAYRVDETIIGLCDGDLAPQLERRLAQAGAAARWIEGKQLADTGPYRLLAAACAYFSDRRYGDFAALVRHADLYDWISRQLKAEEAEAAKSPPVAESGDAKPSADLRFWLTQCDMFYNDRLALRIGTPHLDEEERAAGIGRVVAIVETLFAEWPAEAPLASWADRFRGLLATVFASKHVDRFSPSGRFHALACEKLNEALSRLAEPPPELQPSVGAAAAAEVACDAVADDFLPPPANPDAVELLGWLELPLDDSRALLVTTFNEGFAPKSIAADPFLPNRLRSELGLLDSDRRFARDAYALQLLLATKERLHLLVPRRDAQNNPLAPSRLLFACDDETAAARALHLFSASEGAGERLNPLTPAAGPQAVAQFLRPRPDPALRRGDEYRVTEFRDYLNCPYRYYLRHVLRLESLDDTAAELSASAFGVLLHEALEHFARDPAVRGSDDHLAIYNALSANLTRIAGGMLAPGPNRPAVHVQVEQARLRLEQFAEWQAGRSATGWRIVYAEEAERTLKGELSTGSMPIALKGRIDRIDWHERDRILAILDYKTADTPRTPEQVHQHQGEWIDLQLPLYRHFLAGLALPGVDLSRAQIQLGYVNLPRDLSAIGAKMAEWSTDDLHHADERAREVIAQIRAGVFWPPTPAAEVVGGDFAAICQDYLLGIGKPLDAPAVALAIAGGQS